MNSEHICVDFTKFTLVTTSWSPNGGCWSRLRLVSNWPFLSQFPYPCPHQIIRITSFAIINLLTKMIPCHVQGLLAKSVNCKALSSCPLILLITRPHQRINQSLLTSAKPFQIVNSGDDWPLPSFFGKYFFFPYIQSKECTLHI